MEKYQDKIKELELIALNRKAGEINSFIYRTGTNDNIRMLIEDYNMRVKVLESFRREMEQIDSVIHVQMELIKGNPEYIILFGNQSGNDYKW